MDANARVHGVVLAGGEGKRLRPLTYYFQKCMIPIGSTQKPLLEYVVRLLTHHGVRQVTFLVGYKHEQIVNYFGDGARFGATCDYVHDDAELEGSGWSLVNAYRHGAIKDDGTLLIYYGDILSNMDLGEMLAQHSEEGMTATLATSHGYQIPVGVAEVEGKRIKGWVEKPVLPIYAGIGVLALESRVLRDLSSPPEGRKEFDIMADIIPGLIKSGEPVGCYSTSAFWYDVGSVERYEKIDNGLLDKAFGNMFPERASDVMARARFNPRST
jgi:mannose-1-phosphate guanylyltransferase